MVLSQSLTKGRRPRRRRHMKAKEFRGINHPMYHENEGGCRDMDVYIAATLTSLETGSKVEIRDTIASVHPWMLKGRKGVTMEEKLDAMLNTISNVLSRSEAFTSNGKDEWSLSGKDLTPLPRRTKVRNVSRQITMVASNMAIGGDETPPDPGSMESLSLHQQTDAPDLQVLLQDPEFFSFLQTSALMFHYQNPQHILQLQNHRILLVAPPSHLYPPPAEDNGANPSSQAQGSPKVYQPDSNAPDQPSMNVHVGDGQESHSAPIATADAPADLRSNPPELDPFIVQVEAADGSTPRTREYRVPDGSGDDWFQGSGYVPGLSLLGLSLMDDGPSEEEERVLGSLAQVSSGTQSLPTGNGRGSNQTSQSRPPPNERGSTFDEPHNGLPDVLYADDPSWSWSPIVFGTNK